MAEDKEIQLPSPSKKGTVSLEEAVFKRRSEMSFIKKDLDLARISQLLWSAQGITSEKWHVGFRSAPSAGALYPMEIYLLTKDGLFRYQALGHKLEALSQTDLRDALAVAALGQDPISQAPISIVICAVYRRVTAKYSERGIRYVHIEAGHIAQNIHLQAVTLGLGSVPIGAFDDAQVKEILSLPVEEDPLYIIPVGYVE